MVRLKLLIGLPGSGKTTYAKKLAETEPAWVHLSSDRIARSGLIPAAVPDEPVHHPSVFEEMYRQTAAALGSGADVLYDATNLASKRRRSFLNRIRPFGAETEAIVFLTPYDVLKERNRQRQGWARVPESIMGRYIRSFELPRMDEPFGKVTFLYEKPAVSKETAAAVRKLGQEPAVTYEQICRFYQSFAETAPLLTLESQEAGLQPVPSHQAYTALLRIRREIGEPAEQELLTWTSLLLDIGKPWIRKPVPIHEDTFYGHGHVSAYLAYPLLTALRFPDSFIRDVTLLIDEHEQAWHFKRGKLKRRLGVQNAERLLFLLG